MRIRNYVAAVAEILTEADLPFNRCDLEVFLERNNHETRRTDPADAAAWYLEWSEVGGDRVRLAS